MKRWIVGLAAVATVAGCGGIEVSGIVRDEQTGQPLPGASVTIGEETTRTDLQGSYALEVDGEEPMSVSASKEGYLPQSGLVSLGDSDRVFQDVTLRPVAPTQPQAAPARPTQPEARPSEPVSRAAGEEQARAQEAERERYREEGRLDERQRQERQREEERLRDEERMRAQATERERYREEGRLEERQRQERLLEEQGARVIPGGSEEARRLGFGDAETIIIVPRHEEGPPTLYEGKIELRPAPRPREQDAPEEQPAPRGADATQEDGSRRAE